MTPLQSHYFDKKGRIPVILATEIAFSEILPGMSFSGLKIHTRVKELTQRPSLFPDSTIRKLRLLRQKGKAQFKCVDVIDSLYVKL